MAATKSIAVRNAILSDIRTRCAGGVARFYSGSRPSTPDDAASGTLIAEVTLASPAFAAPSGGSMALSGTPLEDSSANATAQIGYSRFFQSDGTTAVIDLTVTDTGGGGDLTMANRNVTAGEPVRITSATLTQAA